MGYEDELRNRFAKLGLGQKALAVAGVAVVLILLGLFAPIILALVLIAVLVIYFVTKRYRELQSEAVVEKAQGEKGMYRFVDKFGRVHWGTQETVRKWKEEEAKSKGEKEEEEMYERVEDLEKDVEDLKEEVEKGKKEETNP